MIRGTLTLFHWTLQADSRHWLPHVVRGCLGLLLLMMVGAAYSWGSMLATSSGLRFFTSLSYLNVLVITVAGISYFVSAVTEERDDGTLALLKLAGMSSFSILLARSTSRLIGSVMLLVTQVPFTLLAVTLGGVTVLQVFAAYAAMASWLVLIANLALFFSVVSRSSGRAATGTIIFLGLYLGMAPIISASQIVFRPYAGWVDPVGNMLIQFRTDSSILVALRDILKPGYGGGLISRQVVINCSAGLLLFLASVVCFGWRGESGNRAVPQRTGKSRVSRRAWRAALAWKDYRFFTGGTFAMVTKFLGYGILALIFALHDQITSKFATSFWLSDATAWTLFMTYAVLASCEIALCCAGVLYAEIRNRTLITLTLLPLSSGQIIFQKVLGCLISLLPAIFWMVTITIVFPDVVLPTLRPSYVVLAIVMLLLVAHLSMLLSLYMKWAALPVAVLIAGPSSFCCLVLTGGVFMAAQEISRARGMQLEVLLGSLLNLGWVWLFVLLPMEIEIINRWGRLSSEQ